MFPIARYPERLATLGVEVLAAGRVPGPPSPPHEVGVGYPLAIDVCGRIAAVSFAALDVYPEIASVEKNQKRDWVAWLSSGGAPEWDDEPRRRQSYVGIAPAQTARLTVTAGNARERDLRITPWNGAFVVASPGTHSTLAGYDVEGNLLGTLFIGD